MSVPFYLPFVWSNISILTVGIFKGLLMVSGNRLRHNPPRFFQACLFTLLGIIGLILGMYLSPHYPLKSVLILSGIYLLYVFYMRSLPLAFAGICALAGGTIGDLISVWLGVWSYPAAAKIAGIPLYIFFFWGLTGTLMAGLYMVFDAKDSPIPERIKNKAS